MNDAAYAFVEDVKHKKSLVRGNFAKVRGGGRVVRLPSDHLTAKQRKEMNGKLNTYEMDKPHSLNELAGWPSEIQKEYMQNIIDKYLPSVQDVGRMLKCNSKKAYDYLALLGIEREKTYRNPTQKFEWRVFMGEQVSHEEVVEAAAPQPQPMEMNNSIGQIVHLSLHVKGKPMAVAQGIPALLDLNKNYYFSINITEVEEEPFESALCSTGEEPGS